MLEDVSDLSRYLVCDTTYSDGDHVSNELRHMYWFPKDSVKKGDWIKLMTKAGTNSTALNERGTTTHIFYWNLGRTNWNKDGDYAFVAKLESWKVKRA